MVPPQSTWLVGEAERGNDGEEKKQEEEKKADVLIFTASFSLMPSFLFSDTLGPRAQGGGIPHSKQILSCRQGGSLTGMQKLPGKEQSTTPTIPNSLSW